MSEHCVKGEQLGYFRYAAIAPLLAGLQVHEPLRERIALYLRLPPLQREHTDAYIRHRLRCAGCGNDIFEPSALQLIHELVNGLPRLVNTLAEAAMDLAADKQCQSVGLEHVQAAAEIVLPPQIAQVTT
jgi:general secretion pathway protein A